MEVVDDCCGMGSGVKFCFNDFELEFPHILWEIVIVADSSIGEPSGGFCGRVGTLESGFEICDKVGEGPEGGGV